MSYVRTARRHRFSIVRGLGATGSQVVGIGSSLGTPVATAVAGPAVGTALGIGASLAVPLVGAAFAGIVLGIQALMNSGCGQTCVLTSEAANKATSLMSQNLHAYMGLPAPRSKTAQQAYLQNFDQIRAWLQQVCGQPGMGNAGVRCIQNQQAGTCPLKTSPYGWTQDASGAWKFTEAGPAGSGETCWNYFSGFRDPIANDPTVADDSQAAQASAGIASLLSGGSGSLMPLLLVGALILAGVYFL
jgi:hypothetical protein